MLTDSRMKVIQRERDRRILEEAAAAPRRLPPLDLEALLVGRRAEVARKVAASRQAEAATKAAMARCDEHWGTAR